MKLSATLSLVLALAASAPLAASERRTFPESRPATRKDAVAVLCPADDAAGSCVRQMLRPAAGPATSSDSAAGEHSLELLAHGLNDSQVEEWIGPQGLRVRYTDDPRSADHIDATDADGDGVADVLRAVADAVGRARAFLAGQLELPARSVQTLHKTLPMRPITTRRHHAGRHRVEVQVNGRAVADADFTLALPR